jgi:VWFA-related protein
MQVKIFRIFMIAALMAPCFLECDLFAQESPTTFRSEVALVNVLFSATDNKGRLVEGLTKDDFQVFENKQAQKIEYFSNPLKGSEIPLTIALLVDTSASIKKSLDYEKDTAARFFKEILRPDKDLALLIQFDSEVNLVQDFTQNPDDLLNALNSLKAGNSTALYDAVYLASEEKLKNETGRKVMVVITDGEDTASKVHKEEAIEAAQKGDILIYGIGVRSDPGDTNFGVLEKFAKETGGKFFSPKAKLSEIQDAFQSIQKDIQGQYSLAYTSNNTAKDGSFRELDIRCKVAGVRIRSRRGYYAPKASPR